jgi:hypothetical protein
MNTSRKWLITASIVNLVSNSLGTILALQRHLAADWGGSLNGQDVLRDFIGFKGTALSALLSFMLVQLVITWFAGKPGQLGRFGVVTLTFIGLFYTLAQAGEPIFLRQFQAGGFDLAHFVILIVNIVSAITMLVKGVKAWRMARMAQPVMG